MDADTFVRRRLAHTLRTALLLAAALGTSAVVGWVLAGTTGVVWSVVVSALAIVLGPSAGSSMILRASRARPLADHEAVDLQAAVRELARRAGLARAPRLWLVPDATPNAFTVGRRGDAAIAVSRGLLHLLDRRQVIGVGAHEISHVRHGDVWLLSAASVAHRMTALLAMVGRLVVLVSLPLVLLGAVQVSWTAFAVLLAAPFVSTVVQLALSRTREYDADLEAARLTGDPTALASALQRLDDVARPWWRRALMPSRAQPTALLSTHPPSAERVRRLMELAGRRPEVAGVAWTA